MSAQSDALGEQLWQAVCEFYATADPPFNLDPEDQAKIDFWAAWCEPLFTYFGFPALVWTPPSFAGTWADVGPPYFPTAYSKDAAGIVRLRGRPTAASGATIFTLPAAYRPASRMEFPALANDTFAKVIVLPTGEVQRGIAVAGYIQLDGIGFAV